jgi:hypothetical protein
MAGRHEFTAGVSGIMGCKHCGKTEEYLDSRRVDGKLLPCPDAPAESLAAAPTGPELAEVLNTRLDNIEAATNTRLDNIVAATNTRLDNIGASLGILTADFNLQTFDIWTEGGRSTTEQSDFKDALIKFYKRKPFYSNKIRCMATGILQNRDLVIASHIWKQCKHGVGLPKFGLRREDSRDPRNGLLLLRDIELKFDVKEVCFVYNPLTQQFSIKVLNPALMTVVIANSNGKTFADINDQPLQHPQNKIPFRRLLSFHAQCSFQAALEKEWITQQVHDSFDPYHTLSDSASVPDIN